MWMRIHRNVWIAWAILLSALVGAGGCSVDGAQKTFSYSLKTNSGELKNTRYSYDESNTETSAKYFRNVYDAAAGDPAKQRIIRDQILLEMMGVLNENYKQFESNLRDDVTVKNVAIQIASLGTSAAGAAVGSAATKTVLAAITTGLIGANAIVDKQVFFEQSVQALQLQMQSDRAAVQAKIYEGLQKPVDKYPLEMGLNDMLSLYYAGTVTQALQSLVTTTNEKKADETEKANAERTKLLGP